MNYLTIADLKMKNSAGAFETLPRPKIGGVAVSVEPVWSTNYGISASGRRIGKLLRYRTQYIISFPPLSWAQMAQLRTFAAMGFSALQMTDMDGRVTETEVELGILTGTQRSWAAGQQKYDSVTWTLSER